MTPMHTSHAIIKANERIVFGLVVGWIIYDNHFGITRIVNLIE